MMNRPTRRLSTGQSMTKLQKILTNKGLVNGLSEPCTAYFKKNKRHLLGGIMVICFFALFTSFTIVGTSKRIQTLLPNGDIPEYKKWQDSMMIMNANDAPAGAGAGSAGGGAGSGSGSGSGPGRNAISQNQSSNDPVDPSSSSAALVPVPIPIVQEENGPYGSCSIEQPVNTPFPVQPVLVPTFPGGSSDLMKFLIEAATGLWTGNRHDKSNVVAIKTHYPYYDKHVSVDLLKRHSVIRDAPVSAVVILRDPLDTMEVWHTFVENTLNENGDMATPTSTAKWIEWRDHHFEQEISKWELFHRYWLSKANIDPSARHVLVYEDLVDPNLGGQEAVAMIDFIQRMTNVQKFYPDEKIPCIWHKVLQLKSDPYRQQTQPEQQQQQQQQLQQQQQGSRMLRSKGSMNQEVSELVVDNNPNSKPFTYLQLDSIASLLTNMIEDFSYDDKVLSALLKYRSSILKRMSLLKGSDPVLVHNSHGTCIVTTPKYENGIVPIFQASFPGSGSEMMRDLIEAITGYKTNESHRRNDVVSVKTYYPYRKLDLSPGFLNRDMKRVILLIRYPLNAISSNFAHMYWAENNLAPHSMQPPKEAWEKWRDENFIHEIDAWIDHFMFWITAAKPTNRIIVSYEAMYHSEKGPKQAMRLAFFIKGSSANGVEIDPAPAFTIPCLWFRAVKINDQANTDIYQANRYHMNANYIAGFTTEQLEIAATKINSVYRKYNYDLQLGPMLQGYWEHTISLIHAENPE